MYGQSVILVAFATLWMSIITLWIETAISAFAVETGGRSSFPDALSPFFLPYCRSAELSLLNWAS